MHTWSHVTGLSEETKKKFQNCVFFRVRITKYSFLECLCTFPDISVVLVIQFDDVAAATPLQGGFRGPFSKTSLSWHHGWQKGTLKDGWTKDLAARSQHWATSLLQHWIFYNVKMYITCHSDLWRSSLNPCNCSIVPKNRPGITTAFAMNSNTCSCSSFQCTHHHDSIITMEAIPSILCTNAL